MNQFYIKEFDAKSQGNREQLARLIERQANFTNKKCFVIGIGGMTGAGKSYISSIIKDTMQNVKVMVLCTDDYFKYSRTQRIKKAKIIMAKNYAEGMIFVVANQPSMIDVNKIVKDIKKLKKGKEITKNRYDHKTGKIQKNAEKLQITGKTLLIVEGLFALRSDIAKNLDLKIFLECEEEELFKRYLERDKKNRGYPFYKSAKYFFEGELPTYRKYLTKTKKQADIIINTTRI